MAEREPVTLWRIARAWLPLAASWLLMSVELPAVSAVIARLDNPEVNLAAYGSVVFPIALIVEAPIIMLLAASTALCKDLPSYYALRRFAHRTSLVLTILHALIAFTPLFDVVVPWVMDAPSEIIEPARLGMRLMLPWTWPIAYRRFCQGVLIRYGHSNAITIGTGLRLVAMVSVLAILFNIGSLPGVTVAACAVVAGVVTEALYAGWRVRRVVAHEIPAGSPDSPPMRGRAFANFYVPLGLTSLITLIAQPMCSAAMGRMPGEMASLATWPVLIGFIFMLQALGLAYNEVVVAWLDKPEARGALLRFSLVLSSATTIILFVLAATPLADFWFLELSNLPPDMAEMGRTALWLAIPIPMMRALNSWFQGVLVYSRETRPITESVLVYIVVAASVLAYGIISDGHLGLYVSICAYSLGRLTQSFWLWRQSRPIIKKLMRGETT